MKRTSLAVGVVALVAGIVACDAGRGDYLVDPSSKRLPNAQSFARSDWSAPVPLDAPVNNPTANEQAPALSADGLSLYFCSNRAPSAGNDLWVSRRESEDTPWGAPTNLGSTVNSPAGDCGPTISEDGLVLLFTSARTGGAGLNDIYMSHRTDPGDDLSWSAPVRLGAEVNTAFTELSPFITRYRGDECEEMDCVGEWTELYFERGSSNTATDIHVVRIDSDGLALGPSAPVTEVNSAGADGRPTVRFDGREMILQSNRDGRGGNVDLFVATRQSPNHAWSTPEPIGELNVSNRHEIHPYLSKDGRTILFIRGTGSANDIYISTRVPRPRE